MGFFSPKELTSLGNGPNRSERLFSTRRSQALNGVHVLTNMSMSLQRLGSGASSGQTNNWYLAKAGQLAGQVFTSGSGLFFRYDTDNGALYLRLAQEDVAKSLAADAKVVLDTDSLGKVIGIEVLFFGAAIGALAELLGPDSDQAKVTLPEHLKDDDGGTR